MICCVVFCKILFTAHFCSCTAYSEVSRFFSEVTRHLRSSFSTFSLAYCTVEVEITTNPYNRNQWSFWTLSFHFSGDYGVWSASATVIFETRVANTAPIYTSLFCCQFDTLPEMELCKNETFFPSENFQTLYEGLIARVPL